MLIIVTFLIFTVQALEFLGLVLTVPQHRLAALILGVIIDGGRRGSASQTSGLSEPAAQLLLGGYFSLIDRTKARGSSGLQLKSQHVAIDTGFHAYWNSDGGGEDISTSIIRISRSLSLQSLASARPGIILTGLRLCVS